LPDRNETCAPQLRRSAPSPCRRKPR
jgi:hypothetical protein